MAGIRITNVISGLGGGGAERIMTILSNLWASRGKDVHVVVRSDHDPKPHRYGLNAAIGVSYVTRPRMVKSWLPGTGRLISLLALRFAITKTVPDIVIAFMDTLGVDSLLSTIGAHIPVIVAEHCDPNTRPIGSDRVQELSDRISSTRTRVYQRLRDLLYPQAASVVCLTETGMSFFNERIRKKGRIIPNPVLPPPIIPNSTRQNADGKRIVYLGRLDAVKGLDRLLKAYTRIAESHKDWSLELWGVGSEDEALRELARALGVADRVKFKGWADDPYSVLLCADLLAMTSHTEGFPMALCEAMACGVPAVSFDCPSGPRHIIRDGIDGVLVPNGDVEAFAKAMDHLMNNPDELKRLSLRAPEILERYSVEKVLGLWDEVIHHSLRSP